MSTHILIRRRVLALSSLALLALVSAACSGPRLKVATQPSLPTTDLDADLNTPTDLTFTDFSLKDHRGQTVTLSEHTRDAVAVLVFYRGSW